MTMTLLGMGVPAAAGLNPVVVPILMNYAKRRVRKGGLATELIGSAAYFLD
jgi:hypothetical protein